LAEPIPASVIVLTRNEEANLPKCLASASAFSEVFVVDSASSDRTPEIATEHGAQLVGFEWNGDYPKKKQWALENLPFSNDWVLYLDGDEEVTTELANEIRAVLAKPKCAGYFVHLDYQFLGRMLRHGHHLRKLVLFDRRRGRFDEQDDLEAVNAGELELHFQPRIDGAVGTLGTALRHDDREPLFHYFERHNRYSDWEAVLRRKASGNGGPSHAQSPAKVLFNALPLRPLAFFVYSYVVRGGFLDGRAGYHYALAKAFYYWQIRVKELELEEVSRR
jgi:glycosyltransferase involved in cell wall biosynthesis